MKEKVVVIYSGGMDSFTLINKVIRQNFDVYALTFDYGQRHHKEIECAKSVCNLLKIHHTIVNITSIKQLMRGSSLTDDIDIPEGSYDISNMHSTVVPNRNMVLLSMAVSHALSIGATKVFYGAHSGDHSIYPDCRPEFVEKMNALTQICDYHPIQICSPYIYNTKSDILLDGFNMGLTYDKTWTCYKGGKKACGKCGSCIERLDAFNSLHQKDPIDYE